MTNEEREKKRKELAAAALVLLVLKRTRIVFKAAIKTIVVPGITRGLSHAEVTESLRGTSRSVVLNVRSGARAHARDAWAASTGRRPMGMTPTVMDGPAAERAAASLAKQWQEALEVAEGDYNLALEKMLSKFDRTAETEAMDAWNDEFQEQAALAYADGFQLTQRWVAILDTATCASCAALDGTTVSLPDVFVDLPPLHPRCRCFVLSEITSASERAA